MKELLINKKEKRKWLQDLILHRQQHCTYENYRGLSDNKIREKLKKEYKEISNEYRNKEK